MSNKTVFIGGGNMAEALLSGMLSAGVVRADAVVVTDIREERLAELREKYGIQTSVDNVEAVAGADEIWLCVKPQQMQDVLGLLKGLADNARWVSIAAGVTALTLESALGGNVRVVRVMPNTPALVKCGVAGVAAGSRAEDEDVQAVKTALECVGKAVVVAESDLHAVTALSGSGPAYVFYLIESMLAAGEEMGMDPEISRELVLQTVIGAGRLMEETGLAADELRKRVTSKGGTTFAATECFDAREVHAGIKAGTLAAAARSKVLAGE
ncbi:pyrroline-5-carboxylate reductase [Kiritimatiellaeota bacterium B1221]|nr:pyrroline-5-carboxylate reductase [Kiritimatiellaeota bacterium B1221]